MQTGATLSAVSSIASDEAFEGPEATQETRLSGQVNEIEVNIPVHVAAVNIALANIVTLVGKPAASKVRETIETLAQDYANHSQLTTALLEAKTNRIVRARKYTEALERKLQHFRQRCEEMEAVNVELKRTTDEQLKEMLSSTAMVDAITWKYHSLKAEYYRSLLTSSNSDYPLGNRWSRVSSNSESFEVVLKADQRNSIAVIDSMVDESSGSGSLFGLVNAVAITTPRDTPRASPHRPSFLRSLTSSSSFPTETVEPPTGTLILVFTDVQGSTECWDKDELAMSRALEIHNTIMRNLLEEHRGYEVKTEGDAFMVAFAQPLNALRWCVAVQYQLLHAEWPLELLALPAAKEETDPQTGALLWKGLRVRMGIHIGSPTCEVDPRTSRMDYFGPMVNTAARVSGKASGGQIVVSEEFHKSVEHALSFLGEGLDSRCLGAQQLKGISRPVKLFSLLPRGLKGRIFPELSAAKLCTWDQDEEQRKQMSFRRSERVKQKQAQLKLQAQLRQVQTETQTLHKNIRCHKTAIEDELKMCKQLSAKLFDTMSGALHELLREVMEAKREVRTMLDRRSHDALGVNWEGKPVVGQDGADSPQPKPSVPREHIAVPPELRQLTFLAPFLSKAKDQTQTPSSQPSDPLMSSAAPLRVVSEKLPRGALLRRRRATECEPRISRSPGSSFRDKVKGANDANLGGAVRRMRSLDPPVIRREPTYAKGDSVLKKTRESLQSGPLATSHDHPGTAPPMILLDSPTSPPPPIFNDECNQSLLSLLEGGTARPAAAPFLPVFPAIPALPSPRSRAFTVAAPFSSSSVPSPRHAANLGLDSPTLSNGSGGTPRLGSLQFGSSASGAAMQQPTPPAPLFVGSAPSSRSPSPRRQQLHTSPSSDSFLKPATNEMSPQVQSN